MAPDRNDPFHLTASRSMPRHGSGCDWHSGSIIPRSGSNSGRAVTCHQVAFSPVGWSGRDRCPRARFARGSSRPWRRRSSWSRGYAGPHLPTACGSATANMFAMQRMGTFAGDRSVERVGGTPARKCALLPCRWPLSMLGSAVFRIGEATLGLGTETGAKRIFRPPVAAIDCIRVGHDSPRVPGAGLQRRRRR